MEIDITVYITNYNYGNYIEEAIESVLKQQDVDFELIIIDDGSTDHSKEIIESYRGIGNISIVYQKNKGLNVTNNIALRLSKGKYIMRLDADDYLEDDALRLLSTELESDHELGLIFPDYYIVDATGEKLERHSRHDFKKEVSLYDQAAHGACTMIRTRFLKSLGGYNESYKCQDGYELWVKFIQNYKVKNLNKPLFSYRQHGENLTSNEHKILSTRAQINADYIKQDGINVDSIAIIPVRSSIDKYFSLKLKGESLANIKLRQAIDAKNVKKVYLAGLDEGILEQINDDILSNDKFVFFKRSELSARINTSLSVLVDEILSSEDFDLPNLKSLVILDLRFPLITAINIDDAINTLHLFKSDSLISVRNFPNMVFQHNGSGMKAIMEQDNFTKLEREQLYVHVGGITAVNIGSFKEAGKIVNGKVGHIVLNKINGMGIEDSTDLKLAELIAETL